MKRIEPLNSFRKEDLIVASDKSVTHRAIMLGSFAHGITEIEDALLGEDCLATIDCMQRLGARVELSGSRVIVHGTKKPANGANLYVGNSGTTIRLLTGLLCGKNISVMLTGDESICRRPMKRIIEPLSQMNAKISGVNGLAPLSIEPSRLTAVNYTLPIASAQLKSAILFAGLSADGITTVCENTPSRNHSELMLQAMGADICLKDPTQVSVKKSELCGLKTQVPKDISSAAFFAVLAAILKKGFVRVRGVGINTTRSGILEIFSQCGVAYAIENEGNFGGESIADIIVRSGAIKPFEIGGALIPRLIDEIPVLAVLACFAEGRTTIRDAQELRHKESDRIALMTEALRAMGASIEATDDGMIIDGKGYLEGGATVNASGDHRIAMALAVAGAASRKGVTITDDECVAVSFPDFFELLN